MRKRIPTYELYGEETDKKPDFWLHCETLYSRSSLHNFEISLHRHDNFFQFLYVESGTGNVNFDGVLHSFRTPCAIIVPPNFNHGFAFSRNIVGHIVTVLQPQMPLLESGFGTSTTDWMMHPKLVQMEGADEADLAFLALTMRHIQSEYQSRKMHKNSMLESLLKSSLVQIIRHALALQPEHDTWQSYREPRIERLLELIDRHFREHRPVSFYAGQLGLSATHLNRLTRRVAGAPVQHMIARKLIDMARRDLVAMPSSVQHVAYSLGFSDPAYFSRFFQKMTGETPRAFRLRERERLSASMPVTAQ
ncbi:MULTISPECIES: helix-turn-helix domain-containing protein [unclassified Brucella]|uniref:helix-turn-helix domain-containing protein n=1 Tax=unclassified Brucella TaxID=2632610 RepID=UPI00217E286D|nr:MULTISPECIES: helix-turn-helix domain-containing protein [unclassified Brucella]UWF68432.1 helix-turn-helix domain-containing protein [Brucella sp. 1315]UWF71552.1 helix-turn-helix domain-containing protein [Brucella sp. 2594]